MMDRFEIRKHRENFENTEQRLLDEFQKKRIYGDWTELLSENGMSPKEFRKLYIKYGGAPPETVEINGTSYRLKYVNNWRGEGWELLESKKG